MAEVVLPREDEFVSFGAPGQSVAYADLVKPLLDRKVVGGEAAAITEGVVGEVYEATGIDAAELVNSLGDEELSNTRHTHILGLVGIGAGAAILTTLYGIKPNHVRGHSMAGGAAAVVGGYLALRQAAVLYRDRGIEMERIANKEPATMAVTDMPEDQLVALCRRIKGVWPSNFNSPLQNTFAGWTEAVSQAGSAIKKEGFRATPLRNYKAGAAHTAIVKQLRKKLTDLTKNLSFDEGEEPHIPYGRNIDGKTTTEPKAVKADVVAADRPVRWVRGTNWLIGLDIPICHIEIGPGSRRPLSTMLGDHNPPNWVRALHIADILSLQKD